MTQTPPIDRRTLLYTPRPHFIPFHQRDQRWAAMVVHRRGGKTVACVNDLIIRALYCPHPNPRFGYVAPFREQAKSIAWAYLKHYAQPFVQDQRNVRESDLSVRLYNNAVIRLYGADNPDALRGVYFNGLIMDEYGDCRPSLWGEVLLPTLTDFQGWAAFIGTPKGKNHFFNVHHQAQSSPDWYHLLLPADQTDIISQEELRQIQLLQSEEQYAQEFGCSFTAATLGTYYAKLIQDLENQEHIAPNAAAHHPDLPTSVAFDIGKKDSTAMWFYQTHPTHIEFIDYEEHQGQEISFYQSLLDQKPYHYDTIWLPHDAKNRTFASRKTTLEQFLHPEPPHAPYPVQIAPQLSVQHGIDAARLVLRHSRICSRRCYAGVEALRGYKRQYDERTKQFSKTPLHNWASDGADAFRYAALTVRDGLPHLFPKEKPSKLPTQIGPTLGLLEDLHEEPTFISMRIH